MKRFFKALLTGTILFSLIISASAEEIIWSFNDDCTVLTNGVQNYDVYNLPLGSKFVPETVTFLYDEAVHNNGDTDIVSSPDNKNIIFSINYYDFQEIFDVYTNEDGKKSLDKFSNGEYSAYRICYNKGYESLYYDISYEYLNNISSDDIRTLDVSELANADIYQILGFDESDCLAHTCGAIYRFDGRLYYINYEALDNSYFTSEGDFSYRKGTVELIPISSDSEICNAINCIKSEGYYRLYEVDYSENEPSFEFMGESSGIFFWIGTIIIGYIVPCIPLVFGLVLPFTKKFGYTKRWYLLSILALLWIIISTLVLLILFL